MEFDNIEAVRDERGALQLPIEETPEIPSRLQKISGTIRVFERRGGHISDEQMEVLKEMVGNPKTRMLLVSSLFLQMAQQFSGINAVFYYSTSFFEGV